MNIVHITTYLYGGAGRVVINLAINQKKMGHNVTIVTSEDMGIEYFNYSEYIELIKENQIELIYTDSTFKRDYNKNLNAVNKIYEKFKNEKIDVIHAHAAVPSLIAIMLRGRQKENFKIIQTMHGWGLNKNEYQEEMDVNILNMIDEIITVSKADKKVLVGKGCSEEKISVIYNGIEDIIDERCLDLDYKRIKNMKENYYVIGCIGTVGKRKNQKLLIDALINLEREVVLVLIGDIEEEYVDIIKKGLGKVKIEYIGYKRNGAQFIELFDLVCLPSLSEGLPVLITEAMQRKVPILASDIECNKEIIIDDENGYLFHNNNKVSLLGRIEHIMEISHIENIINNAYEKYEKTFKIDKMVQNYIDKY